MTALAQTRPTGAPQAANDAAPAARTLLRFITCGSVDDGKSTLIGRLLAEAGAVPDDVLAAMRADSARLGKAGGAVDYSLLVDGLQAEREQGITIDVAYRYFATARRSFIVADTPGHEQYTRNMATGASGADLAVILVDATQGLLPQTRRHSFIVSLVGVRHVVLAVNKMDLVAWDEAAFRRIEAEYRAAVAGLGFVSIVAVPLSARDGDNVAARSARAPWYEGPTLLGWLETVAADAAADAGEFVLPVQWVNRPDADFRGFSGTVAAGILHPGDAVLALPSGRRARVARIATFDGDLDRAGPGQAVTVTLDAEIDVSRGDVLVAARQPASDLVSARREVLARLLVTADRAVAPGDAFLLRLGTASAVATVAEVVELIDVGTFAALPGAPLGLNGLGLVRLRLDRPLAVADYAKLRELGSLILVDRLTNETAAMGVVVAPSPAATVTPFIGALRRTADATLVRSLGPSWRERLWPVVTWRVGSASLVAIIVLALSGRLDAALLAGTADGLGRPFLRGLHRALWRLLRRRRDAAAGLMRDGGGI